MHEKEVRKGKVLSQGGGSDGSQIGPIVSAQSKLRGLSRNPLLMTSFLFTVLQLPK